MTAITAFLAHEWHRLRLRLEMLWRAIITATLWLGLVALHAALAGSWMQNLLLAALVVLALAALPVLFVQLALLFDAASYLLYREIRFYPLFMDLIARAEAESEQADLLEAPRPTTWGDRLVVAADVLSPLSAISMWVFVVLSRAPLTTHVRPRPVLTIRGSSQQLRRIEITVTDRALHRRGLSAA